jgi:hypothetical protein
MPTAAPPAAITPAAITPAATVLINRGVVALDGPEAEGFLDGLVTNAVKGLRQGEARHAALLSPQGKVLYDFIVVPPDPELGTGFLLDAPLLTLPELVKRLTFYKLRAKVTITDRSADLAVVALWGDGLPAAEELGLAYADPRVPAMGLRAIAAKDQTAALIEAAGATETGNEAYQALRVKHGIAEAGFDYMGGDAFPHELAMDRLHGVDFHKGCYVGQEVVSRMEHRGSGGRTRLIQLAIEGGYTIAEGSEVTAGDKPLGTVGTGAEGLNLARIRMDRLADAIAAGTPVLAGGLPATAVRPAWWAGAWPPAPG